MNNTLLAFFVFWGIWVVVPMLIDGSTALVLFFGVLWARWTGRLHPQTRALDFYPRVSIIIPVLNGERTLGGCLASIQAQTYPLTHLEIVVVDNGSADKTFDVVQRYQLETFSGQLHWISVPFRGKPWALNTGIHLTTGQYVINIDADVVLQRDAVRQMVMAFETNPDISAATGSVEVLPAEADEGRTTHLIAECEFQEYLSAFWMGRQYQSLTNGLYTLAGAFSAFRRETLLQTFLYDKLTVSEDTKLTLDIYERIKGAQVVCIAQAIAYVTPTPSVGALYAQRVRWQRGMLEVIALRANRLKFDIWRVRGLSLTRLMLIDHTLIFPRLIWTFLFPAMTAFGYPLSLVISATLFMYVFYLGIAALMAFTLYLVVDPLKRARLRANWWITFLMPAYRFAIFVFRLAGSITALAEPAEWRVVDPVTATKRAGQQLSQQAMQAWNDFRSQRSVSGRQ
jgi:putative glycosyltransferase (exosortase G-associated)